jgi:hypothetical protein
LENNAVVAVQPILRLQSSEAKAQLRFALRLRLRSCHLLHAVQVRVCGEESNMFKRVLVESDKWEVARAPNEVRAADMLSKDAAQDFPPTQNSQFPYLNESRALLRWLPRSAGLLPATT